MLISRALASIWSRKIIVMRRIVMRKKKVLHIGGRRQFPLHVRVGAVSWIFPPESFRRVLRAGITSAFSQ